MRSSSTCHRDAIFPWFFLIVSCNTSTGSSFCFARNYENPKCRSRIIGPLVHHGPRICSESAGLIDILSPLPRQPPCFRKIRNITLHSSFESLVYQTPWDLPVSHLVCVLLSSIVPRVWSHPKKSVPTQKKSQPHPKKLWTQKKLKEFIKNDCTTLSLI